MKNTIDDNSLELQLPEPLLQEEDVGQIRTIKSDNTSMSVKDNVIQVSGRCISEQELVAVCKYRNSPKPHVPVFKCSSVRFCSHLEFVLK